ncbi:MAG: hypothetical protein LC640_07210 [Frankia sp.]|nr:hypothetical protein [Frankia sp.]
MTRQMPRYASLVVALAVTVGAVGGCTARSVRKVAPVLSDVSRASIVSPNGAARVARDRDHVRAGETVTTAAGGRATMTVLDRRVVLAPSTAVRVPDGAAIDVRTGSVLVDRRRGPGLRVSVGELEIDRISRGALRVERGYAVRVAVLDGTARVSTPTGRRADVPALHQVIVAGRAVPDRAGPLSLRDDTWERDVVPTLVASDVALNRLAAGVDAQFRTAASAIRVVPVGFVRAAAPAGSASDVLLPMAIGRVAHLPLTTQQRIDRASLLRLEGASWGVAAALVGAPHTAVAAALAAALAGALAAVPGPQAVGPGVRAPGGGAPGQPADGESATPKPSPSRSSSGSPSPSTSPSTVVERVVDTVRRLVPTPLPSPTAPVVR